MAYEIPQNGVSTTLASGILSGSSSCLLTSNQGFTNTQYHCLITDATHYEVFEATALAGSTLSITRAVEAYNGVQSAYAFAAGATITIVTSVLSTQMLAANANGTFNVTHYGATGNGTTDDTAAIQACINASSPGSTILFPYAASGIYAISSHIVYTNGRQYVGAGDGQSYTIAIVQASGALIGAGSTDGLFVPYCWNNNTGFADSGVYFYNLCFNGNFANNSTSVADCLIIQNYAATVDLCQFENSCGYGVHQTDVMKNGSNIAGTAGQARITRNYFATINADAYHQTCTAGNAGLDGFFTDNFIGGAVAGVWFDQSAGWLINGNHMWGIAGNGIQAAKCFATRILDNYIEEYGNAANNAAPYYGYFVGIQATVTEYPGCIIRGNHIGCNEGGTAIEYTGINVTNVTGQIPVYAVVCDNIVSGAGTIKGYGISVYGSTLGAVIGSVHGNIETLIYPGHTFSVYESYTDLDTTVGNLLATGAVKGPTVQSAQNTPLQPMAQSTGILQSRPPTHGVKFSNQWSSYPAQASSAPADITPMRDGNLWFADRTAGHGVSKITPAGVITNYALTSAQINQVCQGPDGNIWAADFASGGGVWKITTGGSSTHYAKSGATIHGICVGPDGNFYAADETTGNGVWQITTAGVYTQIPISGAVIYSVITGPDGNIWASCNDGLYRINPWTLAVSHLANSSNVTFQICVGPDNNIWVTDTSVIYVFSPWTFSLVTTITLTGTGPTLNYIASGPDGNVWACVYLSAGGPDVVSIDPLTYTPTYYVVPGINDPNGMCFGPDGQMWITDYDFGSGTGAVYSAPFTIVAGAIELSAGPGGLLSWPDGSGLFQSTSGNNHAAYVGSTSTAGQTILSVDDSGGNKVWSIVSAGSGLGAVETSPPTTATIQTALGNLALGSAYHNTLAYDVRLTVYLGVTANTSAVLKLGVGTTTTPTQTVIVSGTTATGVWPVGFKIPAGQYGLLSMTGTVTDAIVGQYLEAA
jgi:streptogramin lyase